MTRDEVFLKIIDHLTKQNKRAMDSISDTCVYRDDDGNKCAIGCLIPDEEYKQELEGRIVEYIANPKSNWYVPTVGAIAKDVGVGFLYEMQQLHDNDMDPNHCTKKGFIKSLRYIARGTNISQNILDECIKMANDRLTLGE